MFDRIQSLADIIIAAVFFDPQSHLAQALNFFIYDSIKIFLLLVVIVYLMTWLNHIFPIEKVKSFLTKRKLFGLQYLFASMFGALTPFCTCSSIPLFLGFLRAGIPLGVTFTFLITSPLINEVAVALFVGIFGLKITAIYVVTGMLLGMIGGRIIGKLKMEDQVAAFITESKFSSLAKSPITFRQISQDTWALISKIMPYVLLGIAVGGAIHGFIPTGFFEHYITKSNPIAVPLAVLFGIPMYANATGVIPIVQALIAKGIPLGTALAFMMAVVGLSLPEFLMLKRVMKMKLLLSFFGIVALCMIIAGYLFNWLL